MTKEEFAKKIKSKYPIYNSLSDDMLVQKMLTKYPVYRSQISNLNEKDNQSNALSGVLTGAGKGLLSTIEGASSLGERGLRAGLKTILPKPLEKQFGVDKPLEKTGAETVIPEKLRTPEGAAENVGFIAEQIAELFIPTSKVSKATKGLSLGKKVATEALTTGGTVALQEGELNKSVIQSAGISALFPVMGKIFGTVGKQITETIPTRFIRSALNQSKKELLTSGKDAAPYILANKRIGTAGSLIKKSQSEISKLDNQITAGLIKKTVEGVSVQKDDIINSIIKDVNTSGGAINKQEVTGILTKLAPQAKGLLSKQKLTLEEANKLRISLDKTLGDRAFLSGQLPFNKEVLKKFTNTLRETVQAKAPKGTQELFKNLSKEITIRNTLLENIAQKGNNQVLSFGDFIGGGLGGVFGGGLGGVALGVSARRTIESVPFKTFSGVSLNQLKNLQGVLEKLSPVERSALIEIIRNLPSSK